MAGSPIAAYLAELGRELAVTGILRERILAEVADHLSQAADDAISAGLDRHQAERRAVERFGPASLVARIDELPDPAPVRSIRTEGGNAMGRVESLAGTDAFGSLPGRALAWIAERAREASFAPGDTLIEQGAAGRDCYVLLEGAADVLLNGSRIASVGAGDVVGEIALVLNRPRAATVVATADVRALVLSGADLDAEAGAAPAAVVEALTSMALDRIRRAS
jgi:hypothetical protein